jgi:hypothetical protein
MKVQLIREILTKLYDERKVSHVRKLFEAVLD